MDEARTRSRELAAEHIKRGDALGWFDVFYRNAHRQSAAVPWADLRANPNLTDWLMAAKISPARALVVGCGLGDDAEFLASLGWSVTAFDISTEAIGWTRERFPNSTVNYLRADLFETPVNWKRAFDLVVEIYTLQVLPPALRQRAIPIMPEWVADQGLLFIFARGREESDSIGQRPWPLTKNEVLRLGDRGLICKSFEDFMDDDEPPVRRLRAVFQRPKNV